MLARVVASRESMFVMGATFQRFSIYYSVEGRTAVSHQQSAFSGEGVQGWGRQEIVRS
jgi:hypothetical protein